jgi:crossover junction endodeoxyribonuclease RuvC
MGSAKYVAIDPGKKGGIAIYENEKVTLLPTPLVGKELDLTQIAFLLKGSSHVVIEKATARPGQGVTSTFTFGMGYGALQGICLALGVPISIVTPQAWKGVVLAGTQKDKDAAIAYCAKAFPSVSLLPTPKSRTPSDGMADALCILEWGRRKLWFYSLAATGEVE